MKWDFQKTVSFPSMTLGHFLILSSWSLNVSSLYLRAPIRLNVLPPFAFLSIRSSHLPSIRMAYELRIPSELQVKGKAVFRTAQFLQEFSQSLDLFIPPQNHLWETKPRSFLFILLHSNSFQIKVSCLRVFISPPRLVFKMRDFISPSFPNHFSLSFLLFSTWFMRNSEMVSWVLSISKVISRESRIQKATESR